MGTIIIAAQRDLDLYGEYSTIAGNFTYVNASRAEIIEYLLDDFKPDTDRYNYELEKANKRVDRAALTGTSSYIHEGGWEDPIIIQNNQPYEDGILPRVKVVEFMRRLEDEENTDDLLEPFEQL